MHQTIESYENLLTEETETIETHKEETGYRVNPEKDSAINAWLNDPKNIKNKNYLEELTKERLLRKYVYDMYVHPEKRRQEYRESVNKYLDENPALKASLELKAKQEALEKLEKEKENLVFKEASKLLNEAKKNSVSIKPF